MPTFEITGPDGRSYEVEGPDAQGAYEALSTMLQQQGQQLAASSGGGRGTGREPGLQQQSLPQGGLTPEQTRAQTISKELDASGNKAGLSDLAFQGMTFGFGDEALAGLVTPLEMIKRRTWSPAEGYAWAKEREKQRLERGRASAGLAGTAAELVGGVGTGLGLAKAGLTFMPKAASAGLGTRAAGAAADGAGYGLATGIGQGEGLKDSLEKGAQGTVIGGLTGGALPVIGAGISTAAAPFASAISARVNPERFAQRKVAQTVMDSGRAPADMAAAIRATADEGQGMYRLADEMGIEGRNLLATATNAPGPGRNMVADFLEGRNVDAPRRLQGALQDAAGTRQTAAQMQEAMKAARDAEASAAYGAARKQAGAVDVSGALAKADEVLQPGITGMMRPQTDIADNTIQSVTRRARGLMSDGNSQVSDFSAALLAKQNIDDMIRTAQPNQQRVLIGIRNQLDEALSNSSQPYATARDQFRTQSQAMEAIDVGKSAARGGRMEDTIPTFQAMRPDQQAGFRGGYFDDLITKLQQVTPGPTNDASRGLRSMSLDAEIPAFAAPGMGDMTTRRIGREAIMAKTNARALGGSRTAENMNNDAAAGLDPTIVANLLRGNVGPAATAALGRVSNAATGNTAAVRENIARILLGGDDVAPLLSQSIDDIATRNAMLGQLLRGGMGGAAVTYNRPRK